MAVTASVGTLSAAVNVQVVAPGGGGGTTGSAASLSVTTDTTTITPTGTATISAYVRDANNALISGIGYIHAQFGRRGARHVTSDANGVATCTLNTAGDPALRTISVTAATGALNASVNVTVVASTGGTPAPHPC
jgi:hypothetical protein